MNPSGVYFGAGSRVNVGGLVASSLNIADADFLAGRYVFSRDAGRAPGSVVNDGSITAADGGAVALFGGTVTNNGVVAARLGSVAMAAGDRIALDFAGDGLISVSVDAGVAGALVENGGLVRADGGVVVMTARGADALLRTVVNNTGVVEARTLENRSGKIVLLGDMATDTVAVSGKLDASAPSGGDGGFIETSAAKLDIAPDAQITALASAGKAGTWLLDPYNVTIAASGSGSFIANANDTVIDAATLLAALGSANVIVTTGASGSQDGDITVNAALSWNAATNLTLSAFRNIVLNALVTVGSTASGAGLTLYANNTDGTGASYVAGSSGGVATANAPVKFANVSGATSAALNINGSAYSLIFDATQLQNVASGLAGKYALGGDIGLLGVTWSPIGTSSPFSGTFDGLGNTVSDLTLNTSGNFAGLFGWVSGTIANLGVTNVAISGSAGYAGGLAGYLSSGTLRNDYTTGSVASSLSGAYVGGLLGFNASLAQVLSSHSAATTDASGSSSYAGGLVGTNAGAISTSYATGAVSISALSSVAGGLVGNNNNPGATITNAYATGNVSATAGTSDIGGIAGFNQGTISNVYATGTASATGPSSHAGGIVGSNAGTLTNAYTTSGNLVGSGNAATSSGTLTLNALAAALPSGFDSAVWGHAAGATPYLKANIGPVNIASDTSGATYTLVFTNGQLQGIQNYLTGNYALANDLDLTGVTWTPIGAGSGIAAFSGVFDGLGHTVSNLSLALSAQYVGLFGYNTGTIRDVGVTGSVKASAGIANVGGLVGYNTGLVSSARSDVAVTALGVGAPAGGLVGFNEGTITLSSATGAVSGSYAGGLVGVNIGTTTLSSATGDVSGTYAGGFVGLVGDRSVSDSYATGYVTGTYAGGFAGRNSGAIANVYATGAVSGSIYAGGVVGLNMGTLTNAYFATDTTGMTNAYGAVTTGALTLAQLAAALPSGFDSAVWGHADGATPYLKANAGPVNIASDTSGATYTLVFTNGQLQGIQNYLTGNYALANNLDLTGVTWTPIGAGSGIAAFSGIFDGLGHTVSNLSLASSATYVGLFGYNTGTIRDVGVTGTVKASAGGANAGGLVGRNSGTVSSARSDVAVTAPGVGAPAGGLVGFNEGTITLSSATGAVSGYYAGGLVGLNAHGTITLSSATGAVSGSSYAGGLVGYMHFGSVSGSYATGAVSGGIYAGGVIGLVGDGSVSDSYATGAVNGSGLAGGIAGFNDGTISNAYFATDTTGMTNAYGAVTTGALTLAQLAAALPSGFSSSVWGSAAGATPYLKANVGPVNVASDTSGATYTLIFANAQLQGVNNNLSGNYALANNLDLSGVTFAMLGADYVNAFTGVFDGLGNTIANLSLVGAGGTSSNAGLFGYNTGTIRNVTLTNVAVS